MKHAIHKPFTERVLERLHGPKITKVTKGHRKQKLILDAFARCLHEKGLADTSYAAVGLYAEMDPPHIGYYFATWNSMLDACFRYVIATAQEITVERVLAAPDAKSQLKAIVEAPFIHIRQFPEHASVLAAYQLECARNRDYRAAHRMVRKTGQARIQSLLQALNPSPRKQIADFEVLSVMIQSLIAGYATEWVCGRDSDSASLAQKKTWAAVEALLPKSSGGKS